MEEKKWVRQLIRMDEDKASQKDMGNQEETSGEDPKPHKTIVEPQHFKSEGLVEVGLREWQQIEKNGTTFADK